MHFFPNEKMKKAVLLKKNYIPIKNVILNLTQNIRKIKSK